MCYDIPAMQRNFDRLSQKTYDMVIVGGGIYGCALAREAALRGFSVALVEKADFCSATSANSLKIIHGGIRYLQQLDLDRLRQSVTERRILLQIAPHLVHPLSCVMPTYGHGMKSREALWCGLLANSLLSWDRNRGLPPEKRIGRGRTGSRSEWLAIAPEIADPRFNGAAFWQDAYACNTERLGLAFVQAAVAAGADVANYAEVTGFLREGRHVAGVTVVDGFSGKRADIRARLTVINTGPWTRQTLSQLGAEVACPGYRLAFAMNIVLHRQLQRDYAVGLPLYREGWKRSRLYFFVPWRDRTMIGTYMRVHDGDPGAMCVTEQDLDAFMADLNQAHPGARITRGDIAFVHAGLLPSENRDVEPGDEPEPLRHFHLVDHSKSDGIKGLITVLSVKYTTARDVAERALALAESQLGAASSGAGRNLAPLPGGDFTDLDALMEEAARSGLSSGVARRLVHNYGTAYRDVAALGARDRAWLAPLADQSPCTAAEVLHAARNEMAFTLADVVLRRTDLGSAGLPADPVLRRAADLMAGELGWDAARVQKETDALKAERSGIFRV